MSETDLDLLADYIGGALDGTPEQATVAARIATEPRWAQAHAELTRAMAAVSTELATGRPDPMPAEVAARITAALTADRDTAARARGQVDTTGAADRPGRAEPRSASARAGRAAGRDGATGARTTSAPAGREDARTGLAGAGGSRGPGRSARRRWMKWAAPASLAAGVVAFLGIGFASLPANQGDTNAARPEAATDDRVTGGGAPPAAPQEQPGKADAGDGGRPGLRASGTDYRAGTIGTLLFQARSSPPTAALGTDLDDAAPAALRRLTDPAALDTCLAVIGASNTPPASIRVIDFARFEGAAAVVVSFTDRAGQSWVWAVGPNCGVPGVGADTRYSARVG